MVKHGIVSCVATSVAKIIERWVQMLLDLDFDPFFIFKI